MIKHKLVILRPLDLKKVKGGDIDFETLEILCCNIMSPYFRNKMKSIYRRPANVISKDDGEGLIESVVAFVHLRQYGVDDRLLKEHILDNISYLIYDEELYFKYRVKFLRELSFPNLYFKN